MHYELEFTFFDRSREMPCKGIVDNATDAYKWALGIQNNPGPHIGNFYIRLDSVYKDGKEISFKELQNKSVIQL